MSTDNQILSKEEVLSVAKNKWNMELKIIDYEINSYSNEKYGFLSIHKSLKVEVEDIKTKTKHSHTFFIKYVPTKDDPLSKGMADMGVFEREIEFYRKLIPRLSVDFKEEAWYPQIYGITGNTIILEDLRNRNFSLPPSKTFSPDQMKSLLSAIARMHSASIMAENRMGNSLFEIYPEAFNMAPILKPDGFFRKWYQAGIDLGIQLAQQLGMNTNKIQFTCDKIFDLIMPAKGRQNVITHSDLWCNNIMFNDQSPPLCVLIDFQWTRYCPPAQEVILVLHYCFDKKLREKYSDEMLKHYYNEMTRILKKYGLKIFSWQEFMETIEEYLLVAKVFMVLCFPSILMDGDVCAQMMSDPEKQMEFMYSDKGPITMLLYNQGGEYQEKLKQAVIELVELCESSG